MWSNLVPGGGDGGLADRYPISRYQLDYHVDNGVTGLSDPGDTIAQFTASWLFFLSALAMRVVISIFDWSFHVDLITGDHGLLSVSSPIAQHYYQDIVMPFLVSGVIAFGVWIAYKAVKHQHAEVGGAVVRVTIMSVLAIAVLQHPQDTVGRAYTMVADVGESVVTAGQGHTSVPTASLRPSSTGRGPSCSSAACASAPAPSRTTTASRWRRARPTRLRRATARCARAPTATATTRAASCATATGPTSATPSTTPCARAPRPAAPSSRAPRSTAPTRPRWT
jgi:hypothetical protein